MDIDHLGESTIDKLLEQGIIDNVADLYYLKEEEIRSLEGFKEKSAKNLIDSIERSKQRDLSRLIYALGIRHVGKYSAQLLSQHYPSLDKLASSDIEALKAIDGLGEKTAEAVVTFFASEENRELIDRLKTSGVQTQQTPSDQPKIFSRKQFVFTGSLENLTRSQAGDIIKEQGGMVTSSVGKNVDYVVVGKNPGSKYEKAKKQGIKILKEEEFLYMTQKESN